MSNYIPGDYQHDIYHALQQYTPKELLDSTSDDKEKGWRLEAMLVVLGGLTNTGKFNNWIPTTGNFNLQTIVKNENIKDIFYTKSGDPINYRGNGGNASDATFICDSDNKHLLIFTSKNKSNINVGDCKKLNFWKINIKN